MGSPPFLFASRALAAAGLDPAKDVEWVVVAPDVSGLALSNGTADAIADSEPIGIEGGMLQVRCESTAWATQLRLMRAELLAAILERHPGAGVETIRFQGPDAPTWKKGPRSVPGRGPRDTYG